MTMSNIPKPEGGFYQVGDVLETKEQAIAFLKAVGWQSYHYVNNHELLVDKDACELLASEIDEGECLPYTIKGFLLEHTATIATPNPPLAFEEVVEKESTLELNQAWLVWPKKLNINEPKQLLPSQCGGFYLNDLITLDLCLRLGGAVYAHNPAVVPPTERAE